MDITKPNINSTLKTFQFVAALHDIIVSISMGAMAVYHLQYELCAADGLPFGYLLSPFQLGSLQVLFKPRFWKATLAKTNNARAYFFGTGIFVLTVIQALIVPSSAVLVVPQLDWWKVNQPFGGTNGFTYLNASQSYLWPSYVSGSTVPEGCDGSYLIDIPKNCPYADMVAITNWGKEYLNQFSPPNITASSNANMVRYLGGSNYYPKRGYSVVTTGMNHITRALGDIWLYATRHPRVPQYGHEEVRARQGVFLTKARQRNSTSICLCWRVLSVLLTICLKVSGSLYQFLRQLKGRGATRLKRLPLSELCSNLLAAEWTSNNMRLPKSTRPMRILPLHFAFMTS